MNIPLFQVDAFTDTLFKGNPAAVCPLQTWLPDPLLQAIAHENNLSETAFIVPEGAGYRIRWFSPTVEIDLCGHATLATAFVLFRHLGEKRREIFFQTTKKGQLRVTRSDDLITLDFPALPIESGRSTPELAAALGAEPLEVFESDDLLVRLSSEDEVRNLAPDLRALAKLPFRGVIVTAPGASVDFVSRFFGPAVGIDEDPVTGSAHCALAPYWARILGKSEFTARQLSQRTGTLFCRLTGDRVFLSGHAVLYLKGTMELPDMM